jgi:hypothetical protein
LNLIRRFCIYRMSGRQISKTKGFYKHILGYTIKKETIVPCLRHLTTPDHQMYNVRSLMTPIVLVGYRIHHSVCLVTGLTIHDWLMAVEIHLLKQIYPDQIRNTSHGLFSIATIWLPKRCPTVNGVRRHGDVLSFWGNTLVLSLAIRVFGNPLRRSSEIRTRSLRSTVNLSYYQSFFSEYIIQLNKFQCGLP